MAEQEIRVATPDGDEIVAVAGIHPGARVTDGTPEVVERFRQDLAERRFTQTLALRRRNLAPERVGA